ncbi:hypothetical protein Droror1_Dr00018428 [Drosera rotundifolia]
MSRDRPFFFRIVDACKRDQGAYSMVFLTEDKLVAVRDPFGCWPLVMGRRRNGEGSLWVPAACDGPNSYVLEKSVYEVRSLFGEILAEDSPVDCDVVIAVPDSGVVSAIGYAAKAGVLFQQALIRSHHVGRTFIEPLRRSGTSVDDSTVRRTTSTKIVRYIREAGAQEVHIH